MENILPIRPLYFFCRRNSNAGLLVVVIYCNDTYVNDLSTSITGISPDIFKKRPFRLIVNFLNIGINNFPQGVMLCLCLSPSVSVAVWAAMSSMEEMISFLIGLCHFQHVILECFCRILFISSSFICKEMENAVWWDEGSRHSYCLFRKIVQKLDGNEKSGPVAFVDLILVPVSEQWEFLLRCIFPSHPLEVWLCWSFEMTQYFCDWISKFNILMGI